MPATARRTRNAPEVVPAERLDEAIEVALVANDAFDAYARKTRGFILRARTKTPPDENSAVMAEAALAQARKANLALNQKLARMSLSNEVVDDIVAALGEAKTEADDLLDEMERLGVTLDRIKAGADLAAGVLGTVIGIVG